MKYLIASLFLIISMNTSASKAKDWLEKLYSGVEVIIHEEFLVEGTEFTGIVITANDIRGVVYFSDNLQLGMVGTLINKEGENLTSRHIEERLSFFKPQIEKEVLKQKEANKGGLISDMSSLSIIGDRNNKVFVVYDPLCGACSQYKASISDFPEKLRNDISWLPVSIFRNSKDSRVWAAGDIDSKTSFSKTKSTSKSSLLMVMQNTRILQKHIELLTPTVIYINNGASQVVSGMPISELVKLLEKDF